MEKRNIGKNAFVLPMATSILGCHLGGKPNFMALAWLSRVNFRPPMLGVCVNRGNACHGAVSESGQFSVSFPTPELVRETDCVGLVSGAAADKASLFQVFYGELEAAPMVQQCPVCVECSVIQAVELPTNTFFIGEIVGTYSEDRFLSNGAPDIEKIQPLLLSMPDNRYWSLGSCVGRAWRDGKELRDELMG